MVGWRAAEWSELVRTGLRSKGTSLEVAARRVGVPISTFRSWLDGDHLPRVSIFDHWAALAELVGVSESDLLRAAGLLPDSFTSSLLVAQTTRELRAELDRANQVLRQTRSLAQSSAMSQVVNELAASGVNWEIRQRSAHRGEEVRITYHHYVGIMPPDQLASWSDAQLRAYIQHDILADIWQPLSLYWRVAEAHDWPAAPALLIQVPEQEASRTSIGQGPRPDERPIVVLSPPWGYGELLGSLVADAIGFGNVDFRYFGIADDRPDRITLIQREIDHINPGFVVSVSPLLLLDNLDIASGQLGGVLPILVTHGDQVRTRAARIYDDALVKRCGDPQTGIAMVEERNRAALATLPSGSEYLEVVVADEDVTVDGELRVNKMNDTIGWLALQVATLILGRWKVPPYPISGPLRQLIGPSGLLRTPPPMASRVVTQAVE